MKRLLFLWASLLAACSQAPTGNTGPVDTPTSGKVAIAVDETFAPIARAELDVFHAFYPKAHINAHYLPDAHALDLLAKDSVRIALMARELNAEELKALQNGTRRVRTTAIARDAVALIVHSSQQDTTLTMAQLRDMLSGKSAGWKGGSTPLRLVFDHAASSTVRFMKGVAGGALPADRSYAVDSSQAVIDYVAQHPGSIGMIGVNWISDMDDASVMGFRDKVRVLSIAPDEGQPGAGSYYQPFQAYIAQQHYPLTRKIYVHSREPRNGLGTGFTAFLAGEKGQRIILKSGLVPITMPVRLVKVKS